MLWLVLLKVALQGSCWAHTAARCAEFVQLVSSEANEVSDKEKKTTITPEHVLAALHQLGFSEFQEDLQAFYGDVKESNAQQGNGPPAVAGIASSDVPQLLHTDAPFWAKAFTADCTLAAIYCWSLTHRALQASRGKGAGRLALRRAVCLRKSRRGKPSWQCRIVGTGTSCEGRGAEMVDILRLCAGCASAKAVRRGSSAHYRECGFCGGRASCRFDRSASRAGLTPVSSRRS